jgi:arylsulfatase A-like enzyme
VAAFPLDRRFGLSRGFEVYDDRMPRVAGRLASEREGRQVVTRALAWLDQHRGRRFFLWVHLFEPHASYVAPGDGRATAARDDDEVAEADRQIGRVLEGLGNEADATIVVVTADHGEAFGEHGELTHSLFVYDTTLHVPLIVAGPGVRAGTIDEAVSLVDVAPTAARLLGAGGFDADGVDLGPALRGATPAPRTLYAESFAPLLDFGWSPLRSVREAGWTLIDAPRPELYDVARDPGERTDRAAGERTRVAAMTERVNRDAPRTVRPAPCRRLSHALLPPALTVRRGPGGHQPSRGAAGARWSASAATNAASAAPSPSSSGSLHQCGCARVTRATTSVTTPAAMDASAAAGVARRT